MHINLYLIPFVILLGILLGMSESRQNRKLYIILCSAVLVFVAAMRSPEYMTFAYNIDSLNYKNYFEESLGMGWQEAWQSIISRYLGSGNESDAGLILLEKIIGLFTSDFQVYSLFADLLFFIPFGIILYRFTTSIEQIIFAFIFYLALIQVHLLSGARQIFALGFDLMAFISVVDRKRLATVILFLIGISIHFSSILFALPLLMIWFKTKANTLKALHLVCFILSPIVLLIPNEIIVFMGNASGLEKYTAYGEGVIQGGATVFIILIELLSLFCLIAIKQSDMSSNSSLKSVYVMAPLFTLFAPLIRANGTMTRISLYYYIFLCILVPLAINSEFKSNTKTLAYFVVIGILSILTLSEGGIVYYFYWQV